MKKYMYISGIVICILMLVFTWLEMIEALAHLVVLTIMLAILYQAWKNINNIP